ncbi:family M13 unassigned peptidase (M13 family)-like protein, partial [Dinothrombium tinctorium]
AGGFPLISNNWQGNDFNSIDSYIDADTEFNSVQFFFEYAIDWPIIKIPFKKIFKEVYEFADMVYNQSQIVNVTNLDYMKKLALLSPLLRKALLIGVHQPPLYFAGAPLAVNSGGLGFEVAHEITHGFDKSGNLSGHSKESNASKDGNITIKDNVADNGGIQLAYKVSMRMLICKEKTFFINE